MDLNELYDDAIKLLKEMISTPSFSTQESRTAELLEAWFVKYSIPYQRSNNNVWAIQKNHEETKPVVLLNSHHDTVRPAKSYTKDPFNPLIEDGKLYGLGSNDAGGCLVSLLAVFTYAYHQDLTYTLVFAGTAEEEINGNQGISSIIPKLPVLTAAIVGEPTQMQMAIAERGLLVIDAFIKGTASHAAHPNTDNPILKTADFLNKLQKLTFDRISPLLGEVNLSVTQIHAGEQHNAIPDEVHLVIDVRVNDCYSLEEVFTILAQEFVAARFQARSFRLQPSIVSSAHPLVQTAEKLGVLTYGSNTLSDQALLTCPSVKMGPGNSLRSHTADEFIYLHEIKEGIQAYINLLYNLTF